MGQLKSNENKHNIINEFMPYIDTALAGINMTQKDLRMPWNVVPDDTFRLSLIKELFNDPLSTIDEINDQAEFLVKNHDQPSLLIPYIAGKLDAAYDKKEIQDWKFKIEDQINWLNRRKLKKNLPHLYEEIKAFVIQLAIADSLIKRSFSNLTEEEIHILQNEFAGMFRSLPVQTSVIEIDTDISAEEFSPAPSALVEQRQAEYRRMERSRELFAIATKFNLPDMLMATEIVFTSGLKLANLIKNDSKDYPEFEIESSLGLIHFGDNPPQHPLMIISSKADSRFNYERNNISSIQVHIDRGGDDIYEGSYGTQGSGFFGIGLLIDLAGDDIYKSTAYSQGSGFFGSGILIDMNGSDTYSSSYTSQGCGGFGVGLLIDLNGNDIYEGNQYVQGVGWVKGYGGLVDLQGNDHYLSSGKFVDVLRYDDHYVTLSQGMGMGHRPYASGGIGILADKKGNDVYVCDIYGQASAYWFSLGGLVDFEGHDNYLSYQYAQGAGVHLAFAALIDKKGRDLYRTNGVSQGCGHDYAFGALIDLEGDDTYVTEGLSQGAGNANGIGFFLDAEGSDAYIARNANTQGYSDQRRGFGMIGLFFDLDGKDWYGAFHGKDGEYWRHSTYGFGMDTQRPDREKEAEKKKTADKKRDSLRVLQNLAHSVEELFIQASASPLAVQYLVMPARDSLENKGIEAVKYMISRLGTDHVREVHALRDLYRRFGELPTPFLKDSLYSNDPKVSGSALNMLIEMSKDSLGSDAISDVINFTEDKNWRRRAAAYDFIGNFKYEGLVNILLKGMTDPHFHVRRAASDGLVKSAGIDHAKDIKPFLGDTSQLVRYNAEKYFAGLGESGLSFLFENIIINEELDELSRLHALGAIKRMDNVPVNYLEDLIPLLNNDWRYRAGIIEIFLVHAKNESFKIKVRTKLNNEPHPLVNRLLNNF